MHLLEFVPFFMVFAIAGLGILSLWLSLTVWRRRRRAQQMTVPWLRVLDRLVLPLGLLGSLAIILSVTLQSFFPRKGQLFLRDAIVVHADPQRGQPTVNVEGDLVKGAPLVTFYRAGQLEEIERIRLEQLALASERERLSDAPVELDVELVRQQQELATERRHLLQRLEHLQVEHQRIEQQVRTNILDKRVQRHESHAQLIDHGGRLARNAAEMEFQKLLRKVSEGMRDQDLVSEVGYAERVRDVQVLESDATRIEKEREEKRALLADLDVGILSLESMLERHAALVTSSVAAIEASLCRVASDSKILEDRTSAERLRLGRRRQAELRELDLRHDALRQKLLELEQKALVEAPRDGSLLFRHPAPGSAQIGEPLLLFGALDSVRARFKVAGNEADQLRKAGDVGLLATSSELLESRLSGKVVATEALVHEPGMVLVELACYGTKSQLKYLSRGLQLDARLLWTPSILKDPLLHLGTLLLLAALLPALAGRLGRRRPRPIVPLPCVEVSPSEVVRAARVRSG